MKATDFRSSADRDMFYMGIISLSASEMVLGPTTQCAKVISQNFLLIS
jgi:hypothetical protein